MEYIDRMIVYLDSANTNTWATFGSITKLDRPTLTIDDSTMAFISGGAKKHIASTTYDWGSLKFEMSYDPTQTTALFVDALAGTTRHWKFVGKNGRQFSGHLYVKSIQPGSVSGDKSEGEKLSVELQQTGDFVEEVGVTVPTNWYDDVVNLSVSDLTITNPGTQTLVVYGIRIGQPAFVCDNSQLDFTSSVGAKATVGLHTGLCTTVATGATVISVKITAKTTVATACNLTVA